MKTEMIPIKQIKLSENSRMHIGVEDMSELMESIKQNGLLQPIGVIKVATNKYTVAYGNRRFLALSKLGHTAVPAIVMTAKDKFAPELANLTENIQRKNLSLTEIGRYIKILQAAGLSTKEAAIRLGMSQGFIKDCIDAFHRVPEKFRKDLEPRVQGGKKPTPGKIPMYTAQKIISAAKDFMLPQTQVEQLFTAAKTQDNFQVDNVRDYAQSLKAGNKNFIAATKPLRTISIRLLLEEAEWLRITEKHITNGHYKSLSSLVYDVLMGKKAEVFKLSDANRAKQIGTGRKKKVGGK